MKRAVIIILIISAIHFVIAFGSLCLAYGANMEAFDNPDYHLSFFEQTAGKLFEILMQPGVSLWTPWMSKNLPNFIEWILFIINSILWGIVLFFVISLIKLMRRKKSDNN